MITMSRRTVAEPGVPGSAPGTASSSSRPWCAGSSSSGAAEYTPPCSAGQERVYSCGRKGVAHPCVCGNAAGRILSALQAAGRALRGRGKAVSMIVKARVMMRGRQLPTILAASERDAYLVRVFIGLQLLDDSDIKGATEGETQPCRTDSVDRTFMQAPVRDLPSPGSWAAAGAMRAQAPAHSTASAHPSRWWQPPTQFGCTAPAAATARSGWPPAAPAVLKRRVSNYRSNMVAQLQQQPARDMHEHRSRAQPALCRPNQTRTMSSGGARAAVSAEIAPASAMPGSVLQRINFADLWALDARS
jgi:hypothetical protein